MEIITYEYVLNLHELIIPRLEAIKNNGGVSTIHRANELISLVCGWKSLYEVTEEFYRLITWREYIRTAEKWLIEKGKEK